MEPKKAKDYIPIQAGKEGIPEQDMADMVNGFWGKLNKVLSGPDEIRVLVNGMGYFQVSMKKLTRSMTKTTNIINSKRLKLPLSRLEELERKLEKLQQREQDLLAEWARQKEKRVIRKQYIKSKEDNQYDTEGET